MDINEAVRELRRVTGDSLHRFANRLGVSVKAIVNYEEARNPSAEALYRLSREAQKIGREDLAILFSEAFSEKIGAHIDLDTSIESAIGTELGRNNGAEWLETEFTKLVRRARKHNDLKSPGSLKNPAIRLAHIERLLAELRLKTLEPGRSVKSLIDKMSAELMEDCGYEKGFADLCVLTSSPKLYERYREETGQPLTYDEIIGKQASLRGEPIR